MSQPDVMQGPGEGSLKRLVFGHNPTLLDELLEHPEMDEQHLVLLLKNPALPSRTIERVCAAEMFFSSYKVLAALAQNPKTPERYSVRLIPKLFWRDQLHVARNIRISMVLRRKAEQALVERLRSMAVGERIELARMATTEILKALVLDRDAKILTASLQNPRATIETVTRLINSESVEPAFLLAISRMPRWFVLYDVQVALARAPHTPVPLVLKIIPFLKLEDLVLLRDDPSQPDVVIRHAEDTIRLKLEDNRR